MRRYFAARPKPEVENKWLRKSPKKIAVRLETQRMNASNIYTKTNGKETSRPLISSKQPRPGFKKSWTRSGQKQHLPALAENDENAPSTKTLDQAM